MSMFAIVFALALWHLVGFGIVCCFEPEGLEYVNPIWIYDNFKVNIFGVIVLTVVFNLLVPIASLFYWIYKLCTVGRKT